MSGRRRRGVLSRLSVLLTFKIMMNIVCVKLYRSVGTVPLLL